MVRAIDYGLYLVTDRAAARGRGLGMIVRAAVQGGASVVQLRDKDARTRDTLRLAMELKALLGLETRKLSAGQRRRLTLGRLIASPRPLWLLDEPLAPLDARWRDRTGALMAEHLAGGGLIFAAVHDPLPVPSREVSL